MNLSKKSELNFDALPPHQERQFVPKNADLTKLDQIKPLYSQLLEREILSGGDLEKWVLDRSELESVIDQQGSILYILMTCQTDDQQRTQRYTEYIETIVPSVKPLDDQLNKKYLEHLAKVPINTARYENYNREIRADIELFVDANVALETKVELLSQEYQSICGAMTVEFDGQERTLPQMYKFLLETDRGLRERAWRASSQRRLQDSEKLNKLFDDMLALRHKIAVNAGMANFCDYKFKSLHRFDYTPEDCRNYHQTIEQTVVPLWSQILKNRKKEMKLDQLRPWDTYVDPQGQPPLMPFKQVEQLIEGCRKIFHQVNDTLGGQFDQMIDNKLLDLSSRKGKAPGGYQSTLNEARKPVIFMNSVGVDSDVRTLLHEGGHAFHAMACAHDPLLDYRHAPMEFCEVASMGMELIADRYLNVFYQKEDEHRSRQKHFEDIIFTLVWVATIDCFQHWIYDHPQHDQVQRRTKWLEIRRRFSGGVVDWSGLDEEQAHLWHQQLHIFEVPFYYIEYGIAQLGALQLWLNSKKDWKRTIDQYRSGLRLGGSKSLPELFEAAGIQFDFSAKTIAPLVDAVRQELKFTQ